MKKTIEEILNRNRGAGRDSLIPILQEIQNAEGWLSEEAMTSVGTLLDMPSSKVYGVATFYNQFRFQPKGRFHIQVCRGTACHIRGAPQILNEIEGTIHLKEGETSEDLEYTLETVACIGCCALAPCIRVNKDVSGDMTPAKAKELFNGDGNGHGGKGV